ncbi:hypothetical protein UFOVP1365_45 [uncultured Caudovirales phage]|uniref:Uncharacterized protein n=1 Tax=uncultured Caudovirales phage TaxID=2100421 RepID=A0A6J5S2V6_9CAUD|nr:hypothetical protein UFOVP1365_45 [uncultured Caudovirales phage]
MEKHKIYQIAEILGMKIRVDKYYGKDKYRAVIEDADMEGLLVRFMGIAGKGNTGNKALEDLFKRVKDYLLPRIPMPLRKKYE